MGGSYSDEAKSQRRGKSSMNAYVKTIKHRRNQNAQAERVERLKVPF